MFPFIFPLFLLSSPEITTKTSLVLFFWAFSIHFTNRLYKHTDTLTTLYLLPAYAR